VPERSGDSAVDRGTWVAREAGGCSMTVAHDIATFATRASWEGLPDRVKDALKSHLLDALGCGFAAQGAPLVRELRDLARDLGGRADASLFGGGRAPIDRVAFANGAAVRYLDFNDAYLALGETCHPSDNVPALLAAGQYAHATGRTLLAAMAVAYHVQCRLSDEAPVRARGFDHTTQGVCAAAAGIARVLSLEPDRAANALAIAAATSPALRVTRTGDVSQWKGLAAPYAGMMATQIVLLASRGVTGPLAAFEGAGGFMEVLARFGIDWASEGFDRAAATSLKRFNAEVHAQSAIEAVTDLVVEHDIAGSAVDRVVIDVFDVAFDIIGGGSAGPKQGVRTKEQADHSLPYLVAVAVLDRTVMPRQFGEERLARSDVQALLRRVVVRPDPALSASFPREVPCRVCLELHDGRRFSTERRDYAGFASRPMTWTQVVGKFRELTAGCLSAARQDQVVACVEQLETRDVEDLGGVLEGEPSADDEPVPPPEQQETG
jgi:2-methylcitrate dehydratase